MEKLKLAALRAYQIGKTKIWYVLLVLFPFTEQIVDALSGFLPVMLQHGGIYKWVGYAIVAVKGALQFWSFLQQVRAARAAADAAIGASHG